VTELLRMACFLLFVALGIRVLAAHSEPHRRRAINLLLVYAVVLSTVVAVSQVDAWPFSTYRLIQGLWGGNGLSSQVVIHGMDREGREWATDPLSWSPAFQFVLQAWLERTYPKLSPAEQRTAAHFLLKKAEEARRRRANGEWIGHERWLGPLTAPDWWIYRRVPEIPAGPFTGLRASRVDATLGGAPDWAGRRVLLDYRP
jgi:hypothetical protein